MASDRFFLLFAIFQLAYGLFVGGTRFVLVHRGLSFGGERYQHERVVRHLASALRHYLLPALRVTCLLNALGAAAVAVSMGWTVTESFHLVIAVGAATWLRGRAEFASLPAILQDRLGFVSMANSFQNGGFVAVVLAATALGLRSMTMMWWGLALGYALNMVVLTIGNTHERTYDQPGEGQEDIDWRASPEGALPLGIGLVALLGLPVLEQLVLNVTAPGVASIAALSRRLVSAPPAILCTPLGAAILTHAGAPSAEVRKASAERMWAAVAVLGAAAFALTVALCSALWIFRSVPSQLIGLSPALTSELFLFSAVGLLGSVCQVLQGVSARGPQASGNFTSPTIHVLVASGIHAAGIALVALGQPVLLIPMFSSLGWLAACVAELKQLSRYTAPAPAFALEAAVVTVLPTAVGGAGAYLVGGRTALALYVTVAAVAGFAWTLVGPSRNTRDSSWL